MDWMEWSFWQWLGAALALVIAAIGIKVAVSFDINRFLEGQRKRKERRLQALCPHTELTFGQSGDIFVESQFNSPLGPLPSTVIGVELLCLIEIVPQKLACTGELTLMHGKRRIKDSIKHTRNSTESNSIRSP